MLHAYEIRPRKDHRGVDLISDVLPFGRLWYGERNAIRYAQHRSRSHRIPTMLVLAGRLHFPFVVSLVNRLLLPCDI
jgi:hypothetical protein